MLFYVHNADSTQTLIKPLLRLHSSYVTLWQQSGFQIQGRGQRGRFWHSHPGNLFVTGCIQAAANNMLPGQISIVVGVALAQMLESLNINQEISLKWPNDLLINGQKCGGILIERYEDNYLIGVGINIASHPENVETPATHLNLYGNFNVWDIALRVKKSTMNALHSIVIAKPPGLRRSSSIESYALDCFTYVRNDAETGAIDFTETQQQWWNFAKRSANNWVTREPLNGEVIGIDYQGQLLIKMPDGSLQTRHNRL